MKEFIAERVWDVVSEDGLDHPIRAAIAFVGRHAPNVLPLAAGDQLIVNGDDASLQVGSVSPRAIRAYIAAGVQCWALEHLHAKVVIAGHAPGTVLVGSANVSEHSRDTLAEAALRTTDADAVQAATAQFELWKGAAVLIDDAWLNRADALYKPPAPRPRTSRLLPVPTDRRVWLAPAALLEYEPPEEVAASADSQQRLLQHGRGYDTCEAYELAAGDAKRVRVGDVLIRAKARLGHDPRGNASILPWAVVTGVFPGGRGHLPWATVVYQASASPACTVSDLRRAIQGAGSDVDWASSTPFEPGAATGAIWRLWRPAT